MKKVIEVLRRFDAKNFKNAMIQYLVLLVLCIVIDSLATIIMSGLGFYNDWISYVFDVLLYIIYLGIIGQSIHADLFMTLLSIGQFIDTCSFFWGVFRYNRGALIWAMAFGIAVTMHWYQVIHKGKESAG